MTHISKPINFHRLWLIMMILTLSTYLLGQLDLSGVFVMFILLLTAIAKSVFIMRDFMGLRGVSLVWKRIMYGWLGFVCTAIGVSYLFSI